MAEPLVRKLPPTTLDPDIQPKRTVAFRFDKAWSIAHDTVNVVRYEEGVIAMVTPKEAQDLAKNKIGIEVKSKATVDRNGLPFAPREPVDAESN